MKKTVSATLVMASLILGDAWAQGQDSQSEDRDLQVIATMLPGGFDNANQNYFDSRGKHDVKHRRIHITIMATETDNEFLMSSYWDNEPAKSGSEYTLSLSANNALDAVQMSIASQGKDTGCDLFWRREAAQFRATPGDDCTDPVIQEMVLGYKALWVNYSGIEDADFRLHRIRDFECYADIPGVGGGRDEAYERYEGFKIHDQGGAVWFDAKDGRRLGISLFLVDWPINNYEGIFTRDSFVIYVSEENEGVRKEHGYAFTVPDADRIGINLKWMLASCFMKSNKYATPYM